MRTGTPGCDHRCHPINLNVTFIIFYKPQIQSFNYLFLVLQTRHLRYFLASAHLVASLVHNYGIYTNNMCISFYFIMYNYSPDMPESETTFAITPGGISDAKD